MKRIITALFGILMLASPTLQAQLQYKQVGTIKTDDYKFRTSYYPVYTMSKYGEGITLYSKDFLALGDNTLIKELTYFGYQSSDKPGVKFTLWIANTTETTVQPFIVTAPSENNKPCTMVDTSVMTKFAEVSYPEFPAQGSASQAVEIVTFSSENGFEYTGENLVIFVEMNEGLTRTEANATSTTFFTANNANAKCVGAYRDSGYAPDDYGGGYGVRTKAWSYNTSNDVKLPVVKIGYAGERVQINSTVKGRVVSSLNSAGINGATVSLAGQTVTTPNSGLFEITVNDVDMSATYTLIASAPGFDTKSQVIDIKSGGLINLSDIVLTKQAVPAVLSGTVVDANGFSPIAGAEVTFNSTTVTSGADGTYSFSVANVDDLPSDGSTLTAKARGYLPYSTTLQLRGDLSFNIEMNQLPELPGDGVLVGEWGIDSYGYKAPFNPLWRNSEAQMIYPASMLSGLTEGQKFSSLSFFGYYPEPQGATTDPDEGDDDDDYNDYWTAPRREAASRTYNVALYLNETEANAFGGDVQTIDITGMTPVYEGQVTISTGGTAQTPVQLMEIALPEGYEYHGGSLQMVMTSESPLTALLYFCCDKNYTSNVMARSGSGTLESTSFSAVSDGLPVMRLGAYVATGTVSGTVTDMTSGNPLENVEVTLSGNGSNIKAYTDANGHYSISVRDVVLNSRYRLNFSFGEYYDETEDVTFTEQNLNQTINMALENSLDGVESIMGEAPTADIYSVTGCRVLTGATLEQMSRLPKGIYVINGRKVCVK